MIIPTFFDPATISAAGGILGGLGSAFGGSKKQTFIDNSPVQHQMQQRDIANRQKEQAAMQTQRAGEQNIKVQDAAARQRVEALDRIIGTFQQNLRIR